MTSGPNEEFPRENAHVLLDKKEGKTTNKSESVAGQIKHGNKKEDTRSRQIEAAELAPQHNTFNSDEPVKTTNFRDGSRPKQNAVTKGRTKAMSDIRTIDWGILTIQRRKEHRRKLKQNLSSKKQAAEASARTLFKHNSKACTLSEHPHMSQEGLEKARLASLSMQLQSELSVAGVAATTAQKDSNPLEDSQHSSEITQDVQLNPSSNRLQTLEEMIEEEKEIARQLRSVRASCPSPEENRKICQGGDELVAADGEIKEASTDNRFCVIL